MISSVSEVLNPTVAVAAFVSDCGTAPDVCPDRGAASEVVSNDQFFTPAGLLIANGCTRIITLSKAAAKKHGGPYIEFRPDQIVSDNLRAITGPCPFHRNSRHKFFYEFRSKCPSCAMVYLQRQRVAYADYHPGLYYVALADLVRCAAPAERAA